MGIEDRIPLWEFAEESRITGEYTTIRMSGGAVYDALPELEKELRIKFPFLAEGKRTEDRDIEDIDIRGVAPDGQGEYSIELENVKCPLPVTMVQVHHASIKAMPDLADKIAQVLRSKFTEYEAEIKKRFG